MKGNLLSSVRQIYTFCCTGFKGFGWLIVQMNFWPPERQTEQMRLHRHTGFLPLAALLKENGIWQVDAAGDPISPSTVGEVGPNLIHY